MYKTPIGQNGKRITPKNLARSWSKWGDIRLGLDKLEDKWFCQICAKEMPIEIEPFVHQLSDREFLRLCPSCYNKKLKLKVKTHETLIVLIRD